MCVRAFFFFFFRLAQEWESQLLPIEHAFLHKRDVAFLFLFCRCTQTCPERYEQSAVGDYCVDSNLMSLSRDKWRHCVADLNVHAFTHPEGWFCNSAWWEVMTICIDYIETHCLNRFLQSYVGLMWPHFEMVSGVWNSSLCLCCDNTGIIHLERWDPTLISYTIW